jgi:hypothetical protein
MGCCDTHQAPFPPTSLRPPPLLGLLEFGLGPVKGYQDVQLSKRFSTVSPDLHYEERAPALGGDVASLLGQFSRNLAAPETSLK